MRKFKFLHKFVHNTLPTYFNSYKQFFMKKNIVYNLREHVNHVNHVFAEKYLVYQLVKLHNGTTYDPPYFSENRR